MCGINGVIYRDKKSKEELASVIGQMNGKIIHRGPDDQGSLIEQYDNYSIVMGMRRLSIIDLNSGHQPIFSENRQLAIIFNGEIYNYLELRKKLQKQGVKFKTNSDTEVILKLYELEGKNSFSKLDGMFAFSIFDKNKNEVLIARDFFGEKPLYHTHFGGKFIWASELKSLTAILEKRPVIDRNSLNLYFRLTYIPAPFTIYSGIHKLEANHCLIYDLNSHRFTVSQLEETKLPDKKSDIDFKTAKKEVKEMMYESVASRSIADVPLGTFLSGGVDSSIVSLCLSQNKSTPIDTFSIGFEKKAFDETDKSRSVANLIGSNHHEFVIGEKDLTKNIDEILLNFDEPFADSSCLPTYIVANKTRKYVKVALTGDGGDEVFGGYNKYYIGKMNENYTRLVPEKLHRALKSIAIPALKDSTDKRGFRFRTRRLLNSIDYNGQYYWDIISLGFTDKDLANYLLEKNLVPDVFDWHKNKIQVENPSTLTDFRKIDRYISLEGDMLVKVDRTSMLSSLECRAPFLNKKIWDYTNSLPERYLMKGWDKKFILKEAFKDQFEEGFLNKSKSGFGVPVGDWLRSSLKSELESFISDEKLLEQQIFNVPTIKRLVTEHLKGLADNTFMVWTFYCFQKWYYNTYEVIE